MDTEHHLDDLFTEEGKLRHENKYLKDRIKNLEAFKKNFFTAQSELIAANERLETLEDTLNMQSVKQCIIDYGTVNEKQISEQTEHQFGDVMLSFFEESILADSFQDLVMSLFQAVQGLNIDMTVQIHNRDKNIIFALNQDTRDHNASLIEKHKDDGEYSEQENYIVINHLYIKMVITNLSTSITQQPNQVKDYLKIVASGANSRVSSLLKRFELETLKKNIYLIFKKINDSFRTIQDNIDDQAITISELFIDCEKNLNNTLNKAHISEQHNQLIKLIVDTARSELNLILTSSLSLDESFVNVMKKLEKAYAPKDNHII